MQNIKGVDLSYCQKGINYDDLVDEDIKYAILRACYNIYKDNLLDAHIKGCKRVGIDIGYYVYSTARTPDEAIKEAEACIGIISKYDKPTYPVFYDLEEPKIAESVDRKTLTDCAIAFCNTMQEHGYYSGIYTNPSWLLNYYEKDRLVGKFDIWLAHWTDNPDKPSKYDFDQTMWQWGVADIGMKVDGDICFIDYPAKIKSWLDAKQNEGKTPEVEPDAPVIPEEPQQTAKYPVGMQVNMDNTAIYVSSDAEKPANYLSGTYFILSEQIINNRIRITTPKGNTECTGWVNTSDIDNLKSAKQATSGTTATAKPSKKLSDKELDAIAIQVIRGLYGCGTTRRRLLARAGYDYAEVQTRVDELLRK